MLKLLRWDVVEEEVEVDLDSFDEKQTYLLKGIFYVYKCSLFYLEQAGVEGVEVELLRIHRHPQQ